LILVLKKHNTTHIPRNLDNKNYCRYEVSNFFLTLYFKLLTYFENEIKVLDLKYNQAKGFKIECDFHK